jgi:hypothetical protein
MKLIDADKLLLKLNETYDKVNAKYHETDFDSFYGGGCSMIQEVIKEVKEQPSTLGLGAGIKPIDNFVNPFEVKVGGKNE